ncbi:hypothetical protein SAMN06297422_11394 [Lachnospiraceae bacterium]|nr:hypothetical protein SAMN06297422_11394 [Lachnospiraceae bacterium]
MRWMLGYLIGIYLYLLSDMILSFIISLPMGLYLLSFSIFGKECGRTAKNEKFVWRNCHFSVFPVAIFGKPYIKEKEDLFFAFSKLIINAVIFVSIFLFVMIKNKVGIFGMGFVSGITAGSAFCAIIYLVLSFIKILKGDNRILYKLTNAELEKLKNGTSFSQINIYPEMAANKKINRTFRATQWNFCCYNALDKHDYVALGNYLRQMDELLKGPNGYDTFISYTLCYYHIIFYSSYINPNRINAMKFYGVIKDRLESDMEPNGRRVLAYYQLYIMNRPDLAAVTIDQAEQAIIKRTGDDIFTQAELKLEKRLINEIKDNIRRTNEAVNKLPI